jgi:hypothetical protein
MARTKLSTGCRIFNGITGCLLLLPLFAPHLHLGFYIYLDPLILAWFSVSAGAESYIERLFEYNTFREQRRVSLVPFVIV